MEVDCSSAEDTLCDNGGGSGQTAEYYGAKGSHSQGDGNRNSYNKTYSKRCEKDDTCTHASASLFFKSMIFSTRITVWISKISPKVSTSEKYMADIGIFNTGVV